MNKHETHSPVEEYEEAIKDLKESIATLLSDIGVDRVLIKFEAFASKRTNRVIIYCCAAVLSVLLILFGK